jgi:hypothetical protein
MGEGVDPTQMCRSLVNKVKQFEQLRTFADPELLVLFEDWLEELAEETLTLVNETGLRDATALAKQLKISRSGADFLLGKLQKEGRL